MKIGILTFHQSVNNGAVMQAYSLSKRIKREFPDARVEIIDYRMKKVADGYTYSLSAYLKTRSVKSLVRRCAKLMIEPRMIAHLNKRTEVFRSCMDMLPLSELTVQDGEGQEKIIDYINENYDILVVGSDAIWNHVTRGYPNMYLPDSRVRCAKLSYAASCYGMDFLKCSDEVRESIGENLRAFEFLGVRDKATEDFVKWSGCTSEPSHTCDPTAFLDVNDLPIDVEALEKKLSARGFKLDRPTIGIMGSRRMLKMVRALYGKKYQIAALYEYLPGADVQLYDLTPYEWAYVFRYFKLTFTTYFHGTMLSLRNGVPLICIDLGTEFGKKHTPKTLDVLTRVGFSDWYFKTDYETVNIKEIKAKADQLLSGDYRDAIIGAMDAEAESYSAFNDKLKYIIQNKETKNG